MQKQVNKISIVVPCLNEERTISKAITDIKLNINKYLKNINTEIIIADNGSTDKTLKILKKIKGIRVINVPVRGYGAALHYGISKALGKYVIFADADMSYPFSNLKYFSKVMDKDFDLVLGTRIGGKINKGAMPFLHRYIGTPVLTFLIRMIYRIKTTDCNSGMRMIKKSFYKSLNMRNSGMEWASELILKTALSKGKYFEVPISYRKDKRGKKPHLSTWSDGWRHLKAIILLKPNLLLISTFIMFFISLVFYSSNFAITFFLLDLCVVLTYSYLTLNLLGSIIERKENRLSFFLKQFKLVPITLFFAILVGGIIFIVPDNRLGTKLFLVSLLAITFMWIFLIETIKTHLVNKLS